MLVKSTYYLLFEKSLDVDPQTHQHTLLLSLRSFISLTVSNALHVPSVLYN